jgi:hypothetical protein
MDEQTPDGVREKSPAASFTQVVDVPEARDSGALSDISSGSDVTVAEQLAVSPHPEQVDLIISASPSTFVVSPPFAPAMPDRITC